MASLPEYAELHCLSNFSFLRGASHPGELVERARALGYRALALTDECSLAGAVRAHQQARESGLQLILGTEIRVEKDLKLVLLATDRRSYGAIASLVSRPSGWRSASRAMPGSPLSCIAGRTTGRA
jgi:error-prone DNA polymerase